MNTSPRNALAATLLALLVTDASAQVFSRTDDTTYHDNTAAWVLGQVAQSTNLDTGLVESQTTYDAAALPIETRAFGAVQSVNTWWWVGVPRTSTDANGNTTTFSHYSRGIPQRVVLADGETRFAVVDATGLITSTTDETGATTCYAFDAMGRLAKTVHPSETARQTCDESRWAATHSAFVAVPFAEYGIPAGHWRRTVRTGAGVTRQFYDAFWRPLVDVQYDENTIADTASHTVTRYDVVGNAVFRSYPVRALGDAFANLPGTRTRFDALDRPIRVEQDSELGALSTIIEYLPGFDTRTTNARGHSTLTAYLAYDKPSFEHPLWSVEPEDTITEITRDLFGKPIALQRRDRANTSVVVRRYTYDAHQRLCKSIEPETGSTVHDYDAAGNLVVTASGLALPAWAGGAQCEADRAVARASTQRVRRTYNHRNQPASLTFTDGRGDQELAYAKDGMLDGITTWNEPGDASPVVNTYAYNNRRLLVEERSAQAGAYDWPLSFDHDASGHVVRQVFPDGSTLHFALDALGRTTAIRDHANNVYASLVTYYPNGALREFTYGNGLGHVLLQNARQLPERVVDSYVSDLSYGYDANGNPTSIRDTHARDGTHSGNRDLAYDGRDRLASAHLAWWKLHRYRYDALDNIASHDMYRGEGWTTHRYVYDASNRLTNIVDTDSGASVAGLGYDARGNLQNKDGQAYDFDHGNRLRAVVGKQAYRYDGHGRRVFADDPQTGAVRSMYAHDGRLVFDENARTGERTFYIHLAGSLIATREASASGVVGKFHHTDALGSPIAVTDQAGSVIDRTPWEPYGGAIGKPAYQGVGYAGHVVDGASGLVYMQQRYYDPILGRFLSVDPVVADAGNGWNFNRYNYAANNPYRFKDPDGRIIDTVVDVGFIVYDVVQIARHGATTENVAALGADIAGALIPGATGLGAATRGAMHGADALTAGRGANIAENAARGRAGEAATRARLGGEIAGEQVTFKTSDGTRTRADFVTLDGGVIETKTGSARLTSGQAKLKADIDANRPVTPVGNNADRARLPVGEPTIMKSCSVDRHGC